MSQNGVSHRCACVKLNTGGGVSHHFGEVQTSLKKVSRDMIVSQYRAIFRETQRGSMGGGQTP